MSDDSRPLLALTIGDVAGVGPEICAKALVTPGIREEHRIATFGPRKPLQRWLERLKTGLDAVAVGSAAELRGWNFDQPLVPVVDDDSIRVPCATDIFGQINALAGKASHAAVVAAAKACLAGEVDAMVTAPIHKKAWAEAGVKHPGHTEVLAEVTGSDREVMMLAGTELKVVLATIHLPISEVPRAITRERLLKVIQITAESLPLFGVKTPRIAVAGLNPHAGDQGLFGREEIEVIGPSIEEARAEGHDVSGPWPADTVFAQARGGQFDVVIAMFHDQGLAPIKTLDFERTVNITLGLPLIRTSVDHGTAFDIAGKGVANPASLLEAIRWAGEMVANRSRSQD